MTAIYRGFTCALVYGLFLAGVQTVHAQSYTASTGAALRTAINSANSDGVDSTITITGTLILNQTSPSGSGEDANASGDLDILESGTKLTIVGSGTNPTIQVYEVWTSDRIFHVHSGAELVVQGVYLKAQKSMGANVIGDTIYNSGTLTLDTCTLYGSSNVPFGGSSGGIENLGTATITDCVFINSKGKPSTSGGVRNWGNLYVSGTEFNNCRETTYYGSAISNRGGYVEILSSDFHDNVGYGGTVYNSNDGSGNSGLIEIDGTTFTDNQAGGGGAIWNSDGDIYCSNTTFDGNTGAEGGAVHCVPYATGLTVTMEFDTCTFVFNEGPSGGALEFGAPTGATCTAVFYDSLIENNEAHQEGGGLRATGAGTSVSLYDSEIRYNVAGVHGGGIDEHATTVFLSNTPVHSNSPDNIYSVP